jgi:hypothetical protein
VFEIARRIAIEDGEDPDDIEFECRLPNAFLADPPLDEVVAKGVEFGVRGVYRDIEHRVGYFRTVNHDDIIFQSTGRSTGLFANVDETKREGLEAALAGNLLGVDWFSAYSYIDASFESEFLALSPNHAAADAHGEIRVEVVVLRHDADAVARFARRLWHWQVTETDRAAVRRDQAQAAAQRRGLAGAVRAEQPEALAARHAEADVIDDLAVAVDLDQVLHVEHGARVYVRAVRRVR